MNILRNILRLLLKFLPRKIELLTEIRIHFLSLFRYERGLFSFIYPSVENFVIKFTFLEFKLQNTHVENEYFTLVSLLSFIAD